MECSRCGASEGMIQLHDVITGEGIVKLCENCINEENTPIIHRPTEKEIQGVAKKESLYRRLSNMAGINPEEHKRSMNEFKIKDSLKKEEVSLRDLVDKKFDKFIKKESKKKRDDLIGNFHWIIMRARRAKKKSVSQLAKEIEESEKVIKMAEQGVMPEGYVFIRKIEEALGIRILKPEVSEELERQKKQLGFDKSSTENLTIADLQGMKKQEIKEIKEPYWRRIVLGLIGKRKSQDVEESRQKEEDFVQEKPIEFKDTSLEIEQELPEEGIEEVKEDLSDKDINDIIFGRK